MSVIVIVKHRSNIQRLLNGTENRFGKTKERREMEQEEQERQEKKEKQREQIRKNS